MESYSEIDSNKVIAYNLLGRYYLLEEGDIEKSLKFITNGIDAAKKIRLDHKLGNLLSLRAYIKTNFTTDFEGCISDYYEALKIFEAENNLKEISTIYINLGNAYYNYGQLKDAKKYFQLLIGISNKLNDEEGMAIGHSNLGTIVKNDSLATYHLLEAKVYYEKINDQSGVATIDYTLTNLKIKDGSNISEFDRISAISTYKRIKDVFFENNLTNFYVGCLTSIGRELTKIGNAKEGYSYLFEAEKVGKEMQDYNILKQIYENLAINCDNRKDYKMEAQYLIQGQNIKDSLFKENKASAIAEMQTKYDTEKKEAENSLLLAEKELDRAELDKKSAQQKMLMLGLFLALVIVAYVAYSLIQKKKTNKLLNAQNEEISNKNEIIEEKNKDITDSINYAQRIQNAILPVDGFLAKHFESFIYYRPKDIVSGDFYWIKEVNDRIYFSVVDCTGHGVPGAFMSIIGHNSLNRIIDDFNLVHTGEILDKMNELVTTAVGNKSTEEISIRDGMDMSICSIDKKTNILEYSGAQNSLYLLRSNENILEGKEPVFENDSINFYELKADKMAIGGGVNNTSYKTHSIELKKEDTIYLFSDGYADQFGGPKGKKFMYKRFKKMLLDIQDKSMDDQLTHIDNRMKEWVGDMDQLDDICMMGVRI